MITQPISTIVCFWAENTDVSYMWMFLQGGRSHPLRPRRDVQARAGAVLRHAVHLAADRRRHRAGAVAHTGLHDRTLADGFIHSGIMGM